VTLWLVIPLCVIAYLAFIVLVGNFLGLGLQGASPSSPADRRQRPASPLFVSAVGGSSARRLPRQEASWYGKYTIEDGPSRAWGFCEVLDISILGAGLELFEGTGHPLRSIEGGLIDRGILVEVQTPAGAPISLQMLGEIRNSTEGRRGGTRVGMQFRDLSETERAIVNVLEQLQAVS